MLRELGEAYQRLYPHVLVEVRGGGTAIGRRQLDARNADVAAISWQAPAVSLPLTMHAEAVATDEIAIVAHPDNKVAGITLQQVKSLYQGEVLNWAALGWSDLATIVISREDGSGTRAAFEMMVMGNDRVTLDALVMPSSGAVVDYVATHKNAVGYVSQAYLATQGERVRTLAVEDVRPGSVGYHLARTLYLYRQAGAAETVQGFTTFATGPAGQAIVARYASPLR